MSSEAKAKEILLSQDWDFLERYLAMWARKSPGSAKARKSAITRFLSFVNKDALLAVTSDDAEKYLAWLDKEPTRKGTPQRMVSKKTQLALVRSFFKYFTRKARRDFPTYLSPMPDQGEYQFTPDPTPSIVDKERMLEEATFTPAQFLQVLQGLYFEAPGQFYLKVPKEYFVVGLLLVVCGARISEIVSIALDDINLHERYLRTGIAQDARKNNSDGANPLFFCFPDGVARFLSTYIRNVRATYPTTKWLFPGMNPAKHLPTRTFMGILTGLSLPFPVKTHTFRKTLETFYARNGVPLHYIELLSNHAISSIVMRHYVQVTLAERRDLSDKHFPSQYQPLLDWVLTL